MEEIGYQGLDRSRWRRARRFAPVGMELYFMRHRWYEPRTGRFLSPDPIGFAGGPNLYAFAAGDPVNFADPFGLTAGDCDPKDDPNCKPYELPEMGVRGGYSSVAWSSFLSALGNGFGGRDFYLMGTDPLWAGPVGDVWRGGAAALQTAAGALQSAADRVGRCLPEIGLAAVSVATTATGVRAAVSAAKAAGAVGGAVLRVAALNLVRQSAREGAEGLFLQNSGLAQWATGAAVAQHRGGLSAASLAFSFVAGFTPFGVAVDVVDAATCVGR